jgi:RNA polymerase sigma-70 factor (ECF subfamily)
LGVIGAYVTATDLGAEALRAGLAGTHDQCAAAFSTLLDRWIDRSYRLASVMLGNRVEAEDAVADATLRAWQHVSSLREPARFDAWFSRILANVCRDRLRERRDRPSVLAFDPPSPLDPFSESVEHAALEEALAAISPEHRAVLALHYLEGMTVEQIAEHIGTREGTVKSRLHYGVAELRAAYDAASRDPGRTLR